MLFPLLFIRMSFLFILAVFFDFGYKASKDQDKESWISQTVMDVMHKSIVIFNKVFRKI